MVDTSPRVSVYNSPNDNESLATFHPPVCMEGAFVCMILDCSGSMSTSYSMMRTWVERFLESLPLNVGLVIVAYGSNASVLASTSAMTASEKSQYAMSVPGGIHDMGGTNTYDGIKVAKEALFKLTGKNDVPGLHTIFMTDGRANSGPMTHAGALVQFMSEKNEGACPLGILHVVMMTAHSDAAFGVAAAAVSPNNTNSFAANTDELETAFNTIAARITKYSQLSLTFQHGDWTMTKIINAGNIASHFTLMVPRSVSTDYTISIVDSDEDAVLFTASSCGVFIDESEDFITNLYNITKALQSMAVTTTKLQAAQPEEAFEVVYTEDTVKEITAAMKLARVNSASDEPRFRSLGIELHNLASYHDKLQADLKSPAFNLPDTGTDVSMPVVRSLAAEGEGGVPIYRGLSSALSAPARSARSARSAPVPSLHRMISCPPVPPVM